MRMRRFTAGCTAALLLLAALTFAEPGRQPAAPRSPLVPADDLAAQAAFFLDRLDESLADEARYAESQKSRVQKDAALVAILAEGAAALEDNPFGRRRAGVARAGASLAAAAGDWAAARKRLDELKAAMAAPLTETAEKPPPSHALDVPLVMKHTQLLFNRLRQTLGDEMEFEQTRAKGAGYAASLWAVAVALERTPPTARSAPGAKSVEKWPESAQAMRAAAAELNAAAHRGAREAARTALGKLNGSCNACHAAYRRP